MQMGILGHAIKFKTMNSIRKSLILNRHEILFTFSIFVLLNLPAKTQDTWSKSIDCFGQINYSLNFYETNGVDIVGCITSFDLGIPYSNLIKINPFQVHECYANLNFFPQGFLPTNSFKVFNNEIWITGFIYPQENLVPKAGIIAVDLEGTEIFKKSYDFYPYSVDYSAGIFALNDTLLIGFATGTKEEETIIDDFGISIFNSSGVLLSHTWLNTSFDLNVVHDVDKFPGGGYIVSLGQNFNPNSNYPFFYGMKILRLDDTMGIYWDVELPMEEGSSGEFTFDSVNNLYMAWAKDPDSPNSGSSHGKAYVISFKPNGDLRWERKVGNDDAVLSEIFTTSEGNIVGVGYDIIGFGPRYWGWIICLDTSGIILWDRKYSMEEFSWEGGTFSEGKELFDQTLLIYGNLKSQYPLDEHSVLARDNVWVVKTDMDGCVVSEKCTDVNVLTATHTSNSSFNLNISPNPTSDKAIINLAHKGHNNIIKLHITDLFGRMTNTLDYKIINENNIQVDLVELYPGLYTISIHYINYISFISIMIVR
jgi:hypothetical protein